MFLYNCSLQEIVPLNPSNIFVAVDTRPVPKWEKIIRQTLNRVQPKSSKIKSFSDPPSPSKFKPSDDAPDIEEEILLESDSDIGEEVHVHPLVEEHNNILDGVTDKQPITDEALNTSLKDSIASDIVDNDLQNQLSYQRRLNRLNCFRDEDSSENIETTTSSQQISKLSRMVSGTERIGLSWPEPPLHLLPQRVLERPASFKPVKSFNKTKSFRASDSFKSKSDAMDLLADIDLEALMKRKTRSPYVKIVSKQMVGIFITVWVRRSLRKHIQNLKVSTVGVGVMGYIGNKVSFAFFDSIFVAKHINVNNDEKLILFIFFRDQYQ
jgi:hypothetical protein